jgi:hypothetical protein
MKGIRDEYCLMQIRDYSCCMLSKELKPVFKNTTVKGNKKYEKRTN